VGVPKSFQHQNSASVPHFMSSQPHTSSFGSLFYALCIADYIASMVEWRIGKVLKKQGVIQWNYNAWIFPDSEKTMEIQLDGTMIKIQTGYLQNTSPEDQSNHLLTSSSPVRYNLNEQLHIFLILVYVSLMFSVENTLEWFSNPVVIELLWLCCQLILILNEEVTFKKIVGSNNVTYRIKNCRKIFI
jgi:hypothetical protein